MSLTKLDLIGHHQFLGRLINQLACRREQESGGWLRLIVFYHLNLFTLLNQIRVVLAGKGGEGVVGIGLANCLPRQGAADFVQISLVTRHVCTW